MSLMSEDPTNIKGCWYQMKLENRNSSWDWLAAQLKTGAGRFLSISTLLVDSWRVQCITISLLHCRMFKLTHYDLNWRYFPNDFAAEERRLCSLGEGDVGHEVWQIEEHTMKTCILIKNFTRFLVLSNWGHLVDSKEMHAAYLEMHIWFLLHGNECLILLMDVKSW
jgi:hypothetical protein